MALGCTAPRPQSRGGTEARSPAPPAGESELDRRVPQSSVDQNPAALGPAAVPPAAGKMERLEQPTTLPLPVGTKVLHVGDSFAGALGLPLGKLLEDQDVHSVLKHKDASYLTDWAWNGELQKLIWQYNPDLVIITLGGNELEIPEPSKRERTVKKIVSVLGDRPCVWVGVPLWKGPQNGLLDVIKTSAVPCVFVDTGALLDLEKMERLPDGIHPTKAAREEWAAAVIQWLADHRKPNTAHPWSLRQTN